MATRKFRTHRLEYVTSTPAEAGFKIYAEYQALQGPAGWQQQGPRMSLLVPWPHVARDEVTFQVDQAVREALKAQWAAYNEDMPLFD